MLVLADNEALAVPIVAIVFTFIWLIIKALMAPFIERSRRQTILASSGGLTDEEHAVLEKLQRTIVNMERRVESLETILIETHRTKESYGSKV